MLTWLLLLACAPEGDTASDTVAEVDTGGSVEHEAMVQPYLQQVGSTSATVMWQTATGTHSRVDYGTEALEHHAIGTVDEVGTGVVHTVRLEDLEPGTSVSWRARTSGWTSEVQTLRTPATDETDFQLVAMSDMQQDESHPEVFGELVDGGVIPWAREHYGEDLSEALAMVLIPGDLVDNGYDMTEWTDDFFAPGAELFASVPVYPVPGNHEGNTPIFFRYFDLPDNGTEGFEEHWWWTDRGRVRIIGLDSNDGYRLDEQLTWLDTLLDATCTDTGIDFVFAQLHHPFQSELWTDGNTDYTGDVITLLEAFSTDCGKPSVHFFGHTHAYSRGQSQDHSHLMVNVASAGGALDRWGSGGQQDYPEFTVSDDAYGYVMVEVRGGEQAHFTVRRLSWGWPEEPVQSEQIDEVTVYLDPTPPETPTLEASWQDEVLRLQGSAFSSTQGEHGASQWQVSGDCDDFDAPLDDAWVQHQNRYQGEDLAAGVVLTEHQVEGLGTTEVCARVRYRDQGLSWSEWSSAVTP